MWKTNQPIEYQWFYMLVAHNAAIGWTPPPLPHSVMYVSCFSYVIIITVKIITISWIFKQCRIVINNVYWNNPKINKINILTVHKYCVRDEIGCISQYNNIL